MREFELYIFLHKGSPIEWVIREFGYSDQDTYYDKKLNKKFGFATLCVKDGKFKMAYDISFDEKRLEMIKVEPIFDEICKFNISIADSSEQKQMSIKDAFDIIFINFGNNKYRL